MTICRALVCMRCCKHIVFHWSFSLSTDATPSTDSEEPVAEEGILLVKHRQMDVSVLDYRCRGNSVITSYNLTQGHCTRYGHYGIDRTTLCPKYPVIQ